MNNNSCTPNRAIQCTVTNCANHCQNESYCALSSIRVGTHEATPPKEQCTDCMSFRMK